MFWAVLTFQNRRGVGGFTIGASKQFRLLNASWWATRGIRTTVEEVLSRLKVGAISAHCLTRARSGFAHSIGFNQPNAHSIGFNQPNNISCTACVHSHRRRVSWCMCGVDSLAVQLY